MRNYFLYLIFGLIFSNTGLAEQKSSHTLQNKIWDVHAQAIISEKNMIREMRHSRYILLGKVHDNPRHPILQARLIRALAGQGRNMAVFFEMIERSKQNAFSILRKNQQAGMHKPALPFPDTPSLSSNGLEVLLDWKNSGWPEWKFYKPLFDAALQNGFSLWAANFSRYEVGKIHASGLEGLPHDLMPDLLPLLSPPLPTDQQIAMERTINKNHCNMLPDTILSRFATLEKARQALFAHYLNRPVRTRHPKTDGAILIADNSHIRRDRAVPYYLKKMTPNTKVISLAFREVEAGKNHPSDYAEPPEGSKLPYDYVWFTERPQRMDPCVEVKLPNKKK